MGRKSGSIHKKDIENFMEAGMKLLKKVNMRLRVILYRILKRKEQMISISASIGENVFLEGRNSIGENAVLENSYMGYGSYIGARVDLAGCKVGRFCSIGPDVKRIKGTHPTNFVSTHPSFFNPHHPCKLSYVKERKFDDYRYADEKYNIIIKNDVWIGTGAVLVDGITIGNGAVIAAGAVVTKNVPDYAMVGGVPAKLIKFRFDQETIERLLKSRWWDRSIEWIEKHADLFSDVEDFLTIVEAENE